MMMAYDGQMRTTVNLDEDVARKVAELQRERGLGLSAAVNELARAGIQCVRPDYHYEHPTRDLGARMDLTNVADVLALLDEADRPDGSRRDS